MEMNLNQASIFSCKSSSVMNLHINCTVFMDDVHLIQTHFTECHS